MNVPVTSKAPIEEIPAVHEAIRRAERKLGRRGRVLVRYSGTEPVARIMVEGPEERAIREIAGGIAAAFGEGR